MDRAVSLCRRETVILSGISLFSIASPETLSVGKKRRDRPLGVEEAMKCPGTSFVTSSARSIA